MALCAPQSVVFLAYTSPVLQQNRIDDKASCADQRNGQGHPWHWMSGTRLLVQNVKQKIDPKACFALQHIDLNDAFLCQEAHDEEIDCDML